ncbi:HNH endonuclease signature motif containing protein [Streptomyces anatolicus]|nr:HNH endonuclease [Streptomyces anatolicus]
MTDSYSRESLTAAVPEVRNWSALMRLLGLAENGGRRRVLQQKVAEYGIDTAHFTKRSPWRKYTDEAIAQSVAASSTLRQVALRLGATPATGTMSHLARRIERAGLDVSHFPGMNRERLDLPFTPAQLTHAAASSSSVRGTARLLGMPDDSRSREVLARMLREHGVDTAHFRNARLVIDEAALRAAVPEATSFADVVRALGLEAGDVNHRRVRRAAARLGLDTGHFKRKAWGAVPVTERRPVAASTLVVRPPGSSRANRDRLHRALQEVGLPYRCASCGNPGEWLGQRITLHIDHISGDWLDNRQENLRYLCPNCHALTETWCRRKGRQPLAG